MALFVMGAWLVCVELWAGEDYVLRYRVDVDTVGHYLNVELLYESEVSVGRDVLLKMPVWAPGYYLIVDFPKYVCDFCVTDDEGREVQWEKVGKNGWRFFPQCRRTRVSYRVYANERSVAECRVENGVAFVAPNGVFMYVDGDVGHGVEVSYVLPSGWGHVSSGLRRKMDGASREEGRVTFVADDFDVLYDSPVLLGNQRVIRFEHEGHGYELALETPDGLDETSFVEDFRRMVSATTRLMGDVPYEDYCLIHLGLGQGGLEHKNSQACYTGGSFRFDSREDYLSHLSFTTHEYFHLYNVKCIRPVELGPFDYDREVLTPLLWVSEGFTVYYESRNLLRAGLVDSDYVLAALSEFIGTIEGSEGHRHMSLRQSSYDIWLNFFNRAANGRDVRISYYDKGPILGLLFDIDIRRKTDGQRSLDDLMRLLYNRYYKELGRGFTEREFWSAAEEVAGQPLPTLRRYVDTTDEIDYEEMLNDVGLTLDRDTWTLRRMGKPGKRALQLRQQMGL